MRHGLKVFVLIGAIFVLTVVAYYTIRLYSLEIALRNKGYSYRDKIIFEQSFKNGHEFAIVITTKNGSRHAVCLEKNRIGFWEYGYSGSAAETGIGAIGWMRSAGIKRYSQEESPVFSIEWHNLYYGDNATRRIDLEPEQLPLGTAVNIQQAGNEFMIHTVSYEDPEVSKKVSISDLLTGFLKK